MKQSGVEELRAVLRFLESDVPDSKVIVRKSTAILLEGMDHIVQLFSGVAVGRSSGSAEYAKRALVARFLTDMLAAISLFRHGYTVQADALIRACVESIEYIRLVTCEPKWADIWVEGGKSSHRKLRRAVGRQKFAESPMFSLFSERGSHATFESTRATTVVDRGAFPRPLMRMQLGGSLQDPGFDAAFSFGAISMALLQISALDSMRLAFPGKPATSSMGPLLRPAVSRVRALLTVTAAVIPDDALKSYSSDMDAAERVISEGQA